MGERFTKTVRRGGSGMLLAFLSVTPRALAGGVVGTGVPTSCTEAALDAALGGGGAVSFNCGASPVTITAARPKVIATSTNLDGAGLITLSGGGTTRLFLVQRHARLTLANVTVADAAVSGAFGGAIFNEGVLNVTGTIFTNNIASANDDPTSNNGGGAIFKKRALNVTNSSFSKNSASSKNGVGGSGGAIFNARPGTVGVTNSTFSNNSSRYGGAIVNTGRLLGAGRLTVTNCTFSNNSASFTGAGGAIDNGGTLSVSDSTFTNNSAPAGLADNGGPTETIAVAAGSPAINAGSKAGCKSVKNLDQRGFVRPGTSSASCTIGAYEFNSPGPRRH